MAMHGQKKHMVSAVRSPWVFAVVGEGFARNFKVNEKTVAEALRPAVGRRGESA